MLFLCVALSPKLLMLLTLREQYERQQLRLIALEDEVHHLRQVETALQHDRGFSDELSRVVFGSTNPRELSVPVDRQFWLDGQRDFLPSRGRSEFWPWYTPVVRRLATVSPLRISLLILSAVMVVYGFTFLQPSDAAPGIS